MKNDKINIFKLIFIVSLFYYVYWIITLIIYSIRGISSEYVGIHIESLCNHIHTTYYGFEAFKAGIENFIIWTVIKYWYIPLYQFIYIIISLIVITVKYIKKSM